MRVKKVGLWTQSQIPWCIQGVSITIIFAVSLLILWFVDSRHLDGSQKGQRCRRYTYSSYLSGYSSCSAFCITGFVTIKEGFYVLCSNIHLDFMLFINFISLVSPAAANSRQPQVAGQLVWLNRRCLGHLFWTPPKTPFRTDRQTDRHKCTKLQLEFKGL